MELRGHEGTHLLFIIVRQLGARGVTEDGEEWYKGPRGPNPASLSSFFPLRWQAAHSHLGTEEIPVFELPVEFNKPPKLSFLHKIVY